MLQSFPWVFDGAKFLRNCTLEWRAGRFSALTSSQSESPGNKNLLALPGLINLHSHLELTSLAGKLPRLVAFPDWVASLRQQIQGWTPSDYLESARAGARQLWTTGTTTVLDVGNSGANLNLLQESPLRILAMQEILGLGGEVSRERMTHAQAILEAYPGQWPAERSVAGICAHSIYGCNSSVFGACAGYSQSRGQPFTFHLEESSEEHQLLALGSGPMRAWLDGVFPLHEFTSVGPTGLERALAMQMPRRSVIAHGNHLSAKDISTLVRLDATVVHCPQSRAWFGHESIDVEACRSHGVRLCLGSDSLASAESLSLWEQMRLFHKLHPNVPVKDVLAMVTSLPGDALVQDQSLGRIGVGAFADLVIVALPQAFDGENWEWLLEEPIQIKQVIIHGDIVL
jgi:cytosine/adenosine deaminase-related metal-dependent hydrolase